MAKIEKKEILQAVVIADNFNDHFKPFTLFNSPVSTEKLNSNLSSYVMKYRLIILGSPATR